MSTTKSDRETHSEVQAATMQAIVQRRYGTDAASVVELEQIARPAIGNGQAPGRSRILRVHRRQGVRTQHTPLDVR
jgi:hypothetical protein